MKNQKQQIHKRYNTMNLSVWNDAPLTHSHNTHKIKEDRDWWIKKFIDKGLKLIPTPEHFLYKEQVLIFEK